jgi:hypothetical protein
MVGSIEIFVQCTKTREPLATRHEFRTAAGKLFLFRQLLPFAWTAMSLEQ